VQGIGSVLIDGILLVALERSVDLGVHGLTESIEDASEQLVAHFHSQVGTRGNNLALRSDVHEVPERHEEYIPSLKADHFCLHWL
jgi:hypothetical protein